MTKTTIIDIWLNNCVGVPSGSSFNFDRQEKFDKLSRLYSAEKIKVIDEKLDAMRYWENPHPTFEKFLTDIAEIC